MAPGASRIKGRTLDELKLDETSDEADVPNVRRRSIERQPAPPTLRGRKRKPRGAEVALEWRRQSNSGALDQTLTAPRETNPSEDGWDGIHLP